MTLSALSHQSRALTMLRIVVVVFLVLIGLNVVSTLRSGLSNDEQVYMMMTKEVAVGHPVYLTAIDHAPPGIALATVPFVWLFGFTTLAAKVASIASRLLFVGAVFVIARSLQQLSGRLT